MDPRLYSVVDGSGGVYRVGGGQSSSSDGVELAAAAFYADAGGALPSCHQLRSPRSASVVVDGLESTAPTNPVSRDFVARAFYDGGAGRAGSVGPFWERRRPSSFLPDSMAPAVIGGGYDGTTGLPTAGDTRPCRADNVVGGGKDTASGVSSVASSSITSSMTSSSSSSSRKKKAIGMRNDIDPLNRVALSLLNPCHNYTINVRTYKIKVNAARIPQVLQSSIA